MDVAARRVDRVTLAWELTCFRIEDGIRMPSVFFFAGDDDVEGKVGEVGEFAAVEGFVAVAFWEEGVGGGKGSMQGDAEFGLHW